MSGAKGRKKDYIPLAQIKDIRWQTGQRYDTEYKVQHQAYRFTTDTRKIKAEYMITIATVERFGYACKTALDHKRSARRITSTP